MYDHLPILTPLSMPPLLWLRLSLLVLLQLLFTLPLSLTVFLPTDHQTTPLSVPRLQMRPQVPQPSYRALLPREPLPLTRPCFFSGPLKMQSLGPSHRPFKRM